MGSDSVTGGFVVATAGHIDHGKSALVRALTGTHTDRLPEEQRRGMTIDLGFAALQLPSGRTVSIVDVPGHERFVARMVAGAAGVDAALLVVAGDEGVMQQTREHLTVLELLGVELLIVVLTKSDLVDPHLLSLVETEILDLVGKTSLQCHDVIPVSAVTGRGLDSLVQALENCAAVSMARQDGLPLLPVDRVFSMTGFGTVVTGTLIAGQLRVGQDAEIAPAGKTARIRSLQVRGERQSNVRAGARVGLNLAGIDIEDVRRGDVVGMPGLVPRVLRFDGLASVIPGSPVSLGPNQEVVLHAGTVAERARVFPLEGRPIAAGESGWMQVRLSQPIVAWRTQRFILRLPSPPVTIGGGVIADVAPVRAAKAASLQRLQELLSPDADVIVNAVVCGRRTDEQGLARRSGLTKETVTEALQRLEVSQTVVPLGDLWVGAADYDRLAKTVCFHVRKYHDQHPLRSLMPREELRRIIRLDRAEFDGLMDRLCRDGVLPHPDEVEGSLGRQTSKTAAGTTDGFATHEHLQRLTTGSLLDESKQRKVDEFLECLEEARFAPPALAGMMDRFGLDKEILRQLTETGRVVRITDTVYLGAEAYLDLIYQVRDLMQTEGRATVARIRDVLGSSRKYVLAYMEYLDGQHITRRVGDDRVAGKGLDAYRL